MKRELRKFGIFSAGRKKKKKRMRFEGPEIGITRRGFDFRERRRLINAGERQMRREIALLFRDAEGRHGFFGSLGELGEGRAGVDSNPENTRPACVREPADAVHRDRDGFRFHVYERRFHFIEPRLRPFADELRRDVKILDGAPLEARQRAQFCQENAEFFEYLRRELDGRKEAHEESSVAVYLLAVKSLMKNTVVLVAAAAVCLWAADFWQSKPYTEWNDKDIQKIETNSPWSKQVTLALPSNGGGGGSGKGRNRGGNTSEIDGGGGGMSGPARNTGVPDSVADPASGGAGLTVTVSWRTALAMREAAAKQKYGAEVATSPDAKKIIEEEQKVYAILVTGFPGRGIRNTDNLKDTLLKNTSLIIKGKDPIPASDVQTGGNEQHPVILFLFPRTAPITLDDKDVEFSTKLGVMNVKQKFHLKDMVFNGKLDL